MQREWRLFRRKTHHSHLLEAKVAVDGEPYGHESQRLRTKEGQWLCRNIENGYCWAMSDEGMFQLYEPVDRENDDWEALVERMKKKEKIRKKSTKKTSTPKKTGSGSHLFSKKSKD